ncbi:MAG: hypothetical protein GF341_03480 [candidate division Zixibacteria bacterium]|nr:hypothetical protein [candidate division Zixibacteria bacterium]
MTPAIYQLARADFLERIRRYSFLITLGIVVWAGYMLLPSNPSDYITLQMDGHRGVYNSAYVGALISMMGAIYLALVGFYLVKNAIRRDRLTGVGEIIAGTPISRFTYTFGKMLSNLAVLLCMVGVLIVAAGATQFIRGESTTLDLVGLVTPFVFITVPIATVTAGMAVLFESIPGLRGGIGNVVYYSVWTFALIMEVEAGAAIYGHSIFIPSIQQACAVAFPDYSIADGHLSSGIIVNEGGFDLTLFEWTGVRWTADIILSRLWLLIGGLLLPLVAAIFFDRFDSTASVRARMGLRERNDSQPLSDVAGSTVALPEATAMRDVALTPLPEGDRSRFRYVALLRAELVLLLRRHGSWWKIIALGLIVASATVPIDLARSFIWPVAFVWPILLWSSLGWRERRYRVDQIVFATPHPVLRQLSASWLAAVIVTAILGAGMFVRLVITGDAMALSAWIIGVMFVPSMGLALGVITSSGKSFEIVYLLLWYGGLMSKAPPLDFVGVIEGTAHSNQPLAYLIVTLTLIAAAIIGRWRQMRL